MFFFQLSKENLSLAKYEVEKLLDVTLFKYTEKIFLSKDSFSIKLIPRLAFTREVYQILDKNKQFQNLNFQKCIQKNYKLKYILPTTEKSDTKELSNNIFTSLKNPVVNLSSPKNTYIILKINSFWYLTKLIYTNQDDPFNRRAHLRKFNHPTSINPKYAKAMINLVSKKEFLDPFCGSGGLLIEGGLMKLKVNGSDISKKMIFQAKENLNQFKLNANLEVKDALNISKKHEAIVTDLPFGKNSFISQDSDKLVQQFLLNSQNITKNMVIGHLDSLNVKKLISKTHWKKEKSFKIYVHKTMTREITILRLH
ncbi:MAG: DNA methyltransferase [Candidatus Nanoarchaeia archaeon]|nr:DNA methyltransferase [Candidatus Nanoarchaeia archaeon]